MKALVLAGGRGTRLHEFTDDKNKCMHEFRGRPLLAYSLENACRAGVSEIIIVVSYKAESIINHFGNRFRGTPVKYVIQWERKGLVHAIECSAETIDGSDFMLFLGDEILVSPRHDEMIHCYYEERAFALCGTVWVTDKSRISKTYSMIYNEQDHRIYRLIEKPRHPVNNLMGTGNCVFNNGILGYISHTPINQQRGEKELPDLIQCAIDDGQLVRYFDIGGGYININTLEDLDSLNQAIPAETGE
jgi:dTDP-glucose pyrophosphorylase